MDVLRAADDAICDNGSPTAPAVQPKLYRRPSDLPLAKRVNGIVASDLVGVSEKFAYDRIMNTVSVSEISIVFGAEYGASIRGEGRAAHPGGDGQPPLTAPDTKAAHAPLQGPAAISGHLGRRVRSEDVICKRGDSH